MTGVAALVVLASLAAWPDRDTDTGPPPELTLAVWPPRGSLVEDQQLARSAIASWRAAARDGDVDAPGREVDVLYLGDVDGRTVAVLRSWDADTGLLVAAGRDDGAGDMEILDAEVVEQDPSWLRLPFDDLRDHEEDDRSRLRVLAAPAVAETSTLVLRRTESVWNRAAIRDDGVSMPVSSLDTTRPIVAVVRVEEDQRALVDVTAVSPTSLLPAAPDVVVRAPRWGRAAPLSAEEFDSALYAAAAVPAPAHGLAVLASTRVPGGRLVLVEIGSPDTGERRILLVEPGADGAPSVGADPAVSDDLVLAAMTSVGGRTRVLAASAPDVERLEVRGVNEERLVSGIGTTAVVVPPPAPPALTLVGTRDDGSVTSQVLLRLAPDAQSLGQ